MCTVFLFYLSSHYHIYIFKSLSASRDDYFENLGETNALACEMFTLVNLRISQTAGLVDGSDHDGCHILE